MLYYLDETDEHYDPDSNEYYFDRSPTIFSAILDYHRTGNRLSCHERKYEQLWLIDLRFK